MTTLSRLTPRTLNQTASELEQDAADMEARAAQVYDGHRQDGSPHVSNNFQAALYAAARQARCITATLSVSCQPLMTICDISSQKKSLHFIVRLS